MKRIWTVFAFGPCVFAISYQVSATRSIELLFYYNYLIADGRILNP